jgi:hypothetical protein
LERQQPTYTQIGQGKSSEEVFREIFRTMSALENTKTREDQFLSNYMNPLAKTTVFIETGKQKVQS